MMIAQSLSLVLSEAFKWRYVLLVGEGIALSLLLIGFLVGRPDGRKDHGGEEERRLLPPSDGEFFSSSHVLLVCSCSDSEEASQPLSVRQVLTSENQVVRKARESQSDGGDTTAD